MNEYTLNKVKELLKQNGSSYQWLAEELNISKALVGHLLSGERKMTKDRLLSISRALGVDVNDLLPLPSTPDGLTIELRGKFTDRKAKRSFEKAVFAIEDYVTLRGIEG